MYSTITTIITSLVGYPFVIKIAVLIIFLLLILTVMSLFRFFYIRHTTLEEKRKAISYIRRS